MPPKYTPRAPQVGRYWPGKPLKDEPELESSSDEEEEEQEQEQEPQEQFEQKVNNTSTTKLVTTMKTTKISEQGPYVTDEEESSESEFEEEEEEGKPVSRTTRIRQASRRAAGNFVAVDQVDLEEEEVLRSSGNLTNFQSSEEETSEEEESDEEEALPKRPLLRPTFVSK
jgi:hypothetical protein